MILLTDEKILSLISEEKRLPVNFQSLLQLKPKKGHLENEVSIQRPDGSQFKIILRRNAVNHIDFSAILGFIPKQSNQLFRLRRYNGKSHEHTNKLENVTFYGFHIHTATERYQARGGNEEEFAEITNRYADLNEAINCLVADCNIILPDESQLRFTTI